MSFEWFFRPLSLAVTAYVGVAETLSCLPSGPFGCVLISNYQNGQYNPGNQSCAPLHEGVFRLASFVWDHADRDNINALAAVSVAAFTFTLWRTTKSLLDAGERQLAHLSDTAERDLRAYVLIGAARLSRHPKSTNPWEIHITISNFGKTPAYKAVVRSQKGILGAIVKCLQP